MSERLKDIIICAIYGRISVLDPDPNDDKNKDENGYAHNSLQQQEHIGRAVAQQLESSSGIKHIVKHILIEEKGISGKAAHNRPEYQKLLELIRARKIDVVIAKEISRLSRSVSDFCELMELCKSNDVAVRIKGLELDPNTPMGRAMFQMLAVVAELEREMTRERIKSSIRSSMRNDRKINGGRVILGFDRTDKGIWEPNKKELKKVIFLMKTFNETLSYKETIAKAKKKGVKNKNGKDFHKSNIKNLLSNQKYIGKLRVPSDNGSDEWVDLPFGAVVPLRLFEEVQRNIKKIEDQPKNQNRNGNRIYPLTGLLKFEDGKNFRGISGTSRTGETYFYYREEKNDCTVDAISIEKAVVKALRAYEKDPKLIECVSQIQGNLFSRSDFIEQQINDTKRLLAKLDQEESELVEKLKMTEGSGSKRVFKWLDNMLEDIEQRKDGLQQTLHGLERDRDTIQNQAVDVRSLRSSLKVLFDQLEASDPAVMRGIFRNLFNEVVVSKENKIKITWRIPTVNSGGDLSFSSKKWLRRRDLNPRPSG